MKKRLLSPRPMNSRSTGNTRVSRKKPAVRISVVVEKDNADFYAYSPELPGCQSRGDSFDEAMSSIREAVELYAETLSQEELKQLVSKEILSSSVEVVVG
jgi:predicted RNase H-like HicB family nuclease